MEEVKSPGWSNSMEVKVLALYTDYAQHHILSAKSHQEQALSTVRRKLLAPLGVMPHKNQKSEIDFVGL